MKMIIKRRSIMKKIAIALCALFTVTMALTLTGCPTPTETVSVKERMEMFVKDVNAGEYLSLKSHLHPDSNLYSQPNPLYWETYFDTELPLNSPIITGSTSATALEPSGVGTLYTFTLKEDDKDVFKILTISRNGEPLVP